MPIAKKSRDHLRNHRHFIYAALKEYAQKALEIINSNSKEVPIRIIASVRSTRIRIPREIIPEEFIRMVLAENDTKKYRIEFCQNSTKHIYIILAGRPLIEDGQGVILYLFRELLQFLEKKNQKKKGEKNLQETT